MPQSPKPKGEKLSENVTVRMKPRARKAVEKLRGKQSAGEWFFEGRRKEIEAAAK